MSTNNVIPSPSCHGLRSWEVLYVYILHYLLTKNCNYLHIKQKSPRTEFTVIVSYTEVVCKSVCCSLADKCNINVAIYKYFESLFENVKFYFGYQLDEPYGFPGDHQPNAHYGDVITGTIASQITSFTIVYSTVYSDADQRKYQSSASLASVWGFHRGPVNSPHKWPVTRKMFPFDDVIMSNISMLCAFLVFTKCFLFLSQYCILSEIKLTTTTPEWIKHDSDSNFPKLYIIDMVALTFVSLSNSCGILMRK